MENTFQIVDKTKICHYIDCTKNHFTDTVYEDNDLNLFLDFDLNLFGNDNYEEYHKIVEKIKYEYRHPYSEDEYIQGRSKFLKGVLSKSRMFRTEEFFNNYEEIAKNNIKQEIEEINKHFN